MGITINVTAKGRLVREAKGAGTGPKGGRVVFEDTGRTMVGVATGMAEGAMSTKTLEEMASVMIEEVVKATPRDTGALQESVRSEIGASKKGRSQVKILAGGPGVTVTPTKNAPTGIVQYAVKVHETNTPFMFIGIKNAIKRMEDEMAKGLKKAIKGKK